MENQSYLNDSKKWSWSLKPVFARLKLEKNPVVMI